MKEIYQIEASIDDPVENALLDNAIANDPLVCRNFLTIEQAHDALDDFCERKDLSIGLFNVQWVAV